MKRWPIAFTVIVLVSLIGLGWGIGRNLAVVKAIFTPHGKTTTLFGNPTVTPTPTPAATLDPLTIDAITTRSYPGSAITTEQDLGAQTGYHNYLVSYQSDGFKQYALESIPNGTRPAAGWPVVILEHGYIDPAVYQTNGPEYRQFIASFAQSGYAVLKPDFRGHGASQGVPEGGHFSPVYTYDVLNLIASIRQDPQLDAHRIGQFAHSLGGHTALRVAVTSKDVKTTILMAGVVGSFYDLIYNWPHSPMPGDQPAVVQQVGTSLVEKYGWPKDNPTFWDSVSAVNYVSRITGAVQVNQDTDDSTVPRIFSDHLVTALQNAHIATEYHLYPGDDHQFTANRGALITNALAFMKAHL